MAALVYAVATDENAPSLVTTDGATSTDSDLLTLPEFTGDKNLYIFWPMSRGPFSKFQVQYPFNQISWLAPTGDVTFLPAVGLATVYKSVSKGYDVLAGTSHAI